MPAHDDAARDDPTTRLDRRTALVLPTPWRWKRPKEVLDARLRGTPTVRMGAALLALGAIQIHFAVTRGGWWSVLAWWGVAFSIAGAAHVASAPWVLAKGREGGMGAASMLVLLPYFLVTWGRWQLEWWLSSENAWDEVAPGLFVGRWPGRSPLPPGVGLVVDMTAELPAPRWLVGAYEYVSLPTLDMSAPDRTRFAEVARLVAESPVPAYLHCAMGHGRSATMAAAVLLRRRVVKTIPEALDRLRAVRPRVRLEASQRRLLAAYERELAAARGNVP